MMVLEGAAAGVLPHTAWCLLGVWCSRAAGSSSAASDLGAANDG
jgi:hypothetical protein